MMKERLPATLINFSSFKFRKKIEKSSKHFLGLIDDRLQMLQLSEKTEISTSATKEKCAKRENDIKHIIRT